MCNYHPRNYFTFPLPWFLRQEIIFPTTFNCSSILKKYIYNMYLVVKYVLGIMENRVERGYLEGKWSTNAQNCFALVPLMFHFLFSFEFPRRHFTHSVARAFRFPVHVPRGKREGPLVGQRSCHQWITLSENAADCSFQLGDSKPFPNLCKNKTPDDLNSFNVHKS